MACSGGGPARSSYCYNLRPLRPAIDPPMTQRISCLLAVLSLTACSFDANTTVDYEAEARRIAETSIIVGTHVDVPFRLAIRPVNITEATDHGDFDYPRAVAGAP